MFKIKKILYWIGEHHYDLAWTKQIWCTIMQNIPHWKIFEFRFIRLVEG